ncbi:hypothetical protein GQ53DRAFT_175951 [Thozetella sp. PMI_491]|nr:hypothetical protein GQ53DRAFT_175951 [Thozetella sp. PMI_491]
MFVVVVMLLAANTISATTDFTFSTTSPSEAIFCAYKKTALGPQVDFFSIIWLAYAFITRTAQVFLPEPSDPSAGRIFDRFSPRFGRVVSIRAREVKRISTLLKEKRGTIQLLPHVVYLAYIELSSSFAWQIIWLIFSFSYGFSSSVTSWQSCYSYNDFLSGANQTMSPDVLNCLGPATRMGFGQIAPLVLLLLPVLSFLEAFFVKSDTKSVGTSTLDLTTAMSTEMPVNSDSHSHEDITRAGTSRSDIEGNLKDLAATNATSLEDQTLTPYPDPYSLKRVNGSIIFLFLVYLVVVTTMATLGNFTIFIWVFLLDIFNVFDEVSSLLRQRRVMKRLRHSREEIVV